MEPEARSVVVAEHVSKTFRLPHEKNASIKSALINFRKRRIYERQQALKDVSFDIKQGEFFGIVGRNGSGKSTLLKLLAGIYTPTAGSIKVNGSLTPFIELGVGFNPELTGKENVYLNGALLGFSRKEVTKMYSKIVSFAELSKFMDQKLKNYSSGMQVRLAFSIAIQAKSDILLLDEVLAVGDEAFQQKCIDVFEDYKAKKQTIILVTHSMDVVRKFCTRAMLVDSGEIVAIGGAVDMANKYSELNNQAIEDGMTQGNDNAKKAGIKVALTNDKGRATTSFMAGDYLTVDLGWSKKSAGVKNVGVAVVKNSGEFMFGTNTFDLQSLQNPTSARLRVRLDLGAGKYHLMIGLFGERESDVIQFVEPGPEFLILDDPTENIRGMTKLAYQWVGEKRRKKTDRLEDVSLSGEL